MPYLQFLLMLFSSSYSQLFAEYPVYFLILCGFYLTWATAILNLCSMAKARFNWIFLEPLTFFIIVILDANLFIDLSTAKMMYIFFFGKTFVKYIKLMGNIVSQITNFMGLHFLKVKPVKAEAEEQKKKKN